MFLLSRPAPSSIDRFVSDSRHHALSYGAVGVTKSRTTQSLDQADVVIGRGPADFARARQALLEWKQFDLGWVELHPRRADVAIGTNVAVLIRHFGFWSLNGCRVVYHAEQNDTRFGYAYGTLPTHAESGEELFEVALDQQTGDVIYRIRATSAPQAWLAWLGQPCVRMLQAQFRRDSAIAMRRAVNA